LQAFPGSITNAECRLTVCNPSLTPVEPERGACHGDRQLEVLLAAVKQSVAVAE
jgi:hypothetical protein